jgi:hypothetical protein
VADRRAPVISSPGSIGLESVAELVPGPGEVVARPAAPIDPDNAASRLATAVAPASRAATMSRTVAAWVARARVPNCRRYHSCTSTRLPGLSRRVMVSTWATSAHATASVAAITAATARSRAAPRWTNCPALSAPSPVISTPMTVIVVTARPVTASILASDAAGVSCPARSAQAWSAALVRRTGLVTGSGFRRR